MDSLADMYAFRKKEKRDQYGALNWDDDEEKSLMTIESFNDNDSRATPIQSQKSRDLQVEARRLEYCRFAAIATGVTVFLAVAILVIFMRSDAVAQSIENFFG